MAYSRKRRSLKKYGGKHKHTKTCKHSHKRSSHKRSKYMKGGKHRHTTNCKHSHKRSSHKRSSHKRSSHKRRSHKRSKYMNGGSNMLTLSPAPFSLGGATGVNESANTIYNASNYGSSEIPHSNVNMHGGRRMAKSRRNKRGGAGYSFLPTGSELSAKNSGLANVAPYGIYEEIVQK